MKTPANRGFILFEALIAMTIVVGSGFALVDIHHGLQARHLALQVNKTKLWAQASAFEMLIKVSSDHSLTQAKQSTSQLKSSRQRP